MSNHPEYPANPKNPVQENERISFMVDKKNKNKDIIRSSAFEYLTFIEAHGEGGVEAVYAG